MKKKGIIAFVMIVILAFIVQLQVASAATDVTNAVLSISLVNYDPDPTIAGDTAEVRLGIQNVGAQATDNMIVEFVPSYPFSLVPGDSAAQSIGTIQAFQGYYNSSNSMKIIKFNILVDKDAQAGTYQLKFKSYSLGSASSIETSIPIDVKNRASAEVIQIDKTVLIPGKQTPLKFMITNVGNSPLRDLSFSWSNSDEVILPVGSDNTKYIRYIDVGDSADIEYQVMANSDVTAGLYSLSLKLAYTDPLTNTEKEIETTAGMYVGGGTDFDIAFSESSSSQMSFTIANIGSNPASSVSVIIPQQSGWSTTGANSMIIGNLNTGDYTVASFTLQSTQAQTGFQQRSQGNNLTQGEAPVQRSNTQLQNILKVQVAYTDTMGNREIIEKNVSMGQSSASASASSSGNSTSFYAGMPAGARSFARVQQQSFFSEYKTYIIVFVVLVVLILGVITYTKYKKEKLTDPDYKLKYLFKKKEAPGSKRK
jgi:hypothetical protein